MKMVLFSNPSSLWNKWFTLGCSGAPEPVSWNRLRLTTWFIDLMVIQMLLSLVLYSFISKVYHPDQHRRLTRTHWPDGSAHFWSHTTSVESGSFLHWSFLNLWERLRPAESHWHARGCSYATDNPSTQISSLLKGKSTMRIVKLPTSCKERWSYLSELVLSYIRWVWWYPVHEVSWRIE